MLVSRLYYIMQCDGGITAHSRYQTNYYVINAVQVHDLVKTVWPQACE